MGACLGRKASPPRSRTTAVDDKSLARLTSTSTVTSDGTGGQAANTEQVKMEFDTIDTLDLLELCEKASAGGGSSTMVAAAGTTAWAAGVAEDDDQSIADSDFGSQCLSMAYNSWCSEMSTNPGNDELIRALTPDPRPYMYSRLGRRPTTVAPESSQASKEDGGDVIKWKRGHKLGKGSFGTVWCGLTVTGELIAVKQIELTSDMWGGIEAEEEYELICQEVEILQRLKHKNIVGYLGSSYEDGQGNVISIFMQYVPGGSLAHIIQKFGPLEDPVKSHYTRQILEALDYLHSNGLVHRDIKSANIMLMPDGQIKLIDFGCAKQLCTKLGHGGSNLHKSIKGTPYWMAPEVIMETGYGKAADIWSLGCTVYEMCTGRPPWGEFEPAAALYAVGADKPIPELPPNVSSNARDFIDLCLTRDKLQRPSSKKLLFHPFVGKKPKRGQSAR